MAPPLSLHVARVLAIALATLALAVNYFGTSGTEYSTFRWLFFFFYSIYLLKTPPYC
jgi:hypothetical protein